MNCLVYLFLVKRPAGSHKQPIKLINTEMFPEAYQQFPTSYLAGRKCNAFPTVHNTNTPLCKKKPTSKEIRR